MNFTAFKNKKVERVNKIYPIDSQLLFFSRIKKITTL